VEAARADARGFLQVGFNRRFAPLVQKALAHLEGIDGPRFMVFRVNAGPIPADSWINHPEEGGGRILGEVCHFVDLARHLAGAPIRSVQADAAISASDMAEDVSVLLGFTNGSLATIAYTALGDSGIPKERFEVFAGGTALALDNFRSLTLSTGGHAKTHRTRGQDKGIAGSLRAFTKAVASGGPAPIDEAQLFETSRATLAVLQSLQTGARVDF
jgi:predicted dehydrogenase